MRALTDQVIAALTGSGLAVGDSNNTDRSDGDGVPLTLPYVVVFPLVQTRDGSLAEPFSDVDKWHQATCLATTREQAEWLADQVEALLAASDLVLVEMTRSETRRDDPTAAPPQFRCNVRARIRAHA